MARINQERCETITPLGFPVDPEVKRIIASLSSQFSISSSLNDWWLIIDERFNSEEYDSSTIKVKCFNASSSRNSKALLTVVIRYFALHNRSCLRTSKGLNRKLM